MLFFFFIIIKHNLYLLKMVQISEKFSKCKNEVWTVHVRVQLYINCVSLNEKVEDGVLIGLEFYS